MHKVIIAGGGTGGHVFPAIAIAHALKRLQPAISILFVGAAGKMEMEKVPQAGYPIVGLTIAGFDRGAWWRNFTLPFKLLKSLRQANAIFKKFRPDVVIGVGGYASFPMLYLAQRKKIPTVIQEQNSYAGKTNKLLGKQAKKICVAYDGMEQFFPADKIVYTGNPVRANIVQSNIDREMALAFFGLPADRKTLLVVGGSLGARSINESIEAHLEEIVQQEVQVIWQTGQLFYQRALTAARPYADQIKAIDFINQMDHAYAAADVVISRAGALAIAEICVVKKPVVFVPYPYAAEDHQTQNALSLVNKNAALMVPDNEARTELVKKALHLLADEKMQEILTGNMAGLAITDADERIAKEVLTLIQ